MRLLMVVAEMGSGGAEALVADLSVHRSAAGDDVTVASAGGRRADTLAAAGVRQVAVPLHRRSPARAIVAAGRAAPPLRRLRADVVHAHNVGAAVVAHLAVRWPRERPPLLATVHGLPRADYPRAARLLARTADIVVAVSGTEADALTGAGFPAARLRVVDNAVPPPATYDRDAVRAALGIPPGVPVVLSVARLTPPKRPDLLVDAWAALPGDAVLLVAGDGPLAGALAEQVAALGLDGRVRLLGERTDVDRLLAAADAYCLSSDSEGMPMSVLEAMSAGVPVVATAVGGLLAGCDGAARLVPPGSAPALRDALAEVLGDPAERAALADAGRRRVAERFSVEAMRSSYDALYAELAPGSVR